MQEQEEEEEEIERERERKEGRKGAFFKGILNSLNALVEFGMHILFLFLCSHRA